MDFIYLGRVSNTHGLLGELRIISDFKYKNVVFNKGNFIYINDKKYKINSYRIHKKYDMVKLDSINDIDSALILKGNNVYINRLDYKFEGLLNEDLIGLSIYDNDKYKGKVVDILSTKQYDLLVVDGIKKHLIPNINEFIEKVDLENKKIYVKYIGGLDNED